MTPDRTQHDLCVQCVTGLFPLCGLEVFVGQVCLRMVGSVEPSFVEPAQTMWLNVALMLAVNIAMLPFELLLITPFTLLGAKVMRASVPDVTSKMWAFELLRHPKETKVAMLHSCVGWALMLPFLVGGTAESQELLSTTCTSTRVRKCGPTSAYID